jgi:ubiquinone/menaquinone biosynthesis C-methylase UbiE
MPRSQALGQERSVSQSHWESVYRSKPADAVSWYAPHLNDSLHYIRQANPGRHASILDVGGGESTLVDDLLGAGYDRVAVLDLSAHALAVCRDRLGERAARVDWLLGDVLELPLGEQAVDVWHDRAVFHFLTEPAQRQAYVQQVRRAVKPGGHVIVGAFGPEGPTQCSGLPVARYTPVGLHDEFGGRFQLLDHRVTVHTTPWGSPQQFVYCFCRVEH